MDGLTYSYVLLIRDKEGTIIESIEVTPEVKHLYCQIEYQERIIKAYRKQVGDEWLNSSTVQH